MQRKKDSIVSANATSQGCNEAKGEVLCHLMWLYEYTFSSHGEKFSEECVSYDFSHVT
jgi:hypothetical protein